VCVIVREVGGPDRSPDHAGCHHAIHAADGGCHWCLQWQHT
jgi:hypothetical protein